MSLADDEQIRANVLRIRTRIAAAASRAHRDPDAIRLVAVTKSASRPQMEALDRLGIADLAESRPQRIWERASWVPTAQWHLVGHLQRNKVERTIPLVRYVHSVDSDRLLDCVYHHWRETGASVSLLLQVNISDESAKHGWRVADMTRVAQTLAQYPGLPVLGLMGMASLAGSPTTVRHEFRSLRIVSEQLREKGLLPQECHELSMGMSHDFEIAIEEGATMVRIGSALLEGGTA